MPDAGEGGAAVMSLNERIIQALAPAGIPCVPDTHAPDGGTYYTFAYNTAPAAWGNNSPDAEICDVSVHLWGAAGVNLLALRLRTRQLLHAGGFTWPYEVNASDEDGQHYLYECQIPQPVQMEG